MNIAAIARFSVFLLFIGQFASAAENGFADDASIRAFLHDNFDGKNVGMVVGLVDEHGSRVFGAGRLDSGNSQELNGDTIFEIGSITKTFTALLLQDAVERGEMKLEDPLWKYLPISVWQPNCHGKDITLLNLAAQDSGLPFNPSNFSRGDNYFADYTEEKLYTFLSNYTQADDAGKQFHYSNLGMGLLGHILSLHTHTNYESLVADRICRPLLMHSTGTTLTPQLKARLARGHDATGKMVPNWEFQALAGCGALHSTANDLLKFVAANLGLTQSRLTPSIEKTHVIRHTNAPAQDNWPAFGNTAMPWVDCEQSAQTGLELLGHAGGTAGYSAFIGFDKPHHRGLVVLCNQQGGAHSQTLGWLLLEGVPLTPRINPIVFPANTGELVGVGLKLRFDRQSRTLQTEGALPNTPASRAGLSPGLIVQKVDGVPTAGKNTDLCLCYFRGKPGTKVQLELVDATRKKTNTLELTRQKFTPPK